MRQGVLAIMASLLAPVLVEASDPVWVFIEPPSAEAERDFQEAKKDAKADIAAGILKVRVGGFRPVDEERTRRLAKLGIEEVDHGCVVGLESVYSNIYYAAMSKEIEMRYGKDFWTRFDAELEAWREKTTPKRDPVADRKYWAAVADHVASYWKVPPDVPRWHWCGAFIHFDAQLASAETRFVSCYEGDRRLEASIAQAVQASLPLPAEIVALRTPGQILITFAVDQDAEPPVMEYGPEWESIKEFLKRSADSKQ